MNVESPKNVEQLKTVLARLPSVTLCLKVGGVYRWKNNLLEQSGPSLVLIHDSYVVAYVDVACCELCNWATLVQQTFPAALTHDFGQNILAPGLLEGHAHLFLLPNGEVPSTDVAVLTEQAFSNAELALRQGILWLRDCGDPHAINLAVRNSRKETIHPNLRACGAGIHRRKRYGKQLGIAVEDDAGLIKAAQDRIHSGVDDVKIMLSGIVKFETEEVPGDPQFSEQAVSDVVQLSHDQGRRVVVHASGPSATALVARAGVDTIEHAYFATEETLHVMAKHSVAWLPTLAPVYAQWHGAEKYGHPVATKDALRRILNRHEKLICKAAEIGVKLVGGSDSGSPGVGHGRGAALELSLLIAAGLDREKAYAACSLPGANRIGFADGKKETDTTELADFAILSASPLSGSALNDTDAFFNPVGMVRAGKLLSNVSENVGVN